MKTQMVFRSVVLCVGLGSVGFALRGLAPLSTMVSLQRDVPRLEYFASAQSFSEVEQVRAQLEALSRRHLYMLQVRQVEALQGARAGGTGGKATGRDAVGQVVQELGQAIQEFQGTGEEAKLTNGLLILLASEGSYGRWLDVYLDLLYRRPTEDVVGRLTETAVVAGRETDRLDEVLRGFRHLAQIPMDFEGRRRAEAVLRDWEQHGPSIQASRRGRWTPEPGENTWPAAGAGFVETRSQLPRLRIARGTLQAERYALLGDNRSLGVGETTHAVVARGQLLGRVIGTVPLWPRESNSLTNDRSGRWASRSPADAPGTLYSETPPKPGPDSGG